MRKVIALVVALIAPAASAGELDNIWSQMLSASSGPQAVSTNRRNGVSLGSVSIRVKSVQDNVIAARAPYLQASCKGIDFFGGSLSILKKEELVQMARSLVASAPMYAFQLAFDMLCPDCNAILADLADRLNNLNQYITGDCEKLTSMIDETWGRDKKIAEWRNNFWQSFGVNSTNFYDSYAAAMGDKNNGDEKAKMDKLGPKFSKAIQQNSTVETVNTVSLSLPLISADKRVVGEFLMNLIGTYTSRVDASLTASKEDGGQTLLTSVIPKFELKYFYDPAPSQIGITQKQWRCTEQPSTDPNCLKVSERDVGHTDHRYIHSFMETIGDSMCGLYDANKAPSSIMHRVSNKTAFSASQKQILNLLSEQLRMVLIDSPGISEKNTRNCRLASQLASIRATEELMNGVSRFVKNLSESKAAQDKGFKDLTKRVQELEQQKTELTNDKTNLMNGIDTEIQILDFTRNRN